MFLIRLSADRISISVKKLKTFCVIWKQVNNSTDDIAVARIINVPKRGIGATSIGKAQAYAVDHNINLYNALELAYMNPELSRAQQRLRNLLIYWRIKRVQSGAFNKRISR